MGTNNSERTEELIAQSLHDDLSPAERVELERLLQLQPDLRAEAAGMKQFIERITADPVVYTGDLRAAVIAEISRAGSRRFVLAPRWLMAAAAFALVGGGALYWTLAHPRAAVAPNLQVAEHVAPSAAPAEDTEIAALIASRDYVQAYATLEARVKDAPRSMGAARNVQAMADLAFANLQWYDEAFAGYDRLRRDYVDQFQANEENFVRLNLLDEARGPAGDYASLRALDAARRDNDTGAYENILAKYPATYVASEAAHEYAIVVARAEGLDASEFASARALEMAQAHVKDPVAKVQLRIEVAHALRANPAQAAAARRIYTEIANGPYTTLAQLAQKSLAAMDAREPGL